MVWIDDVMKYSVEAIPDLPLTIIIYKTCYIGMEKGWTLRLISGANLA